MIWAQRQRETRREMSEGETGRQRGTERERPWREEEGEGLNGPRASSNLWHGKKEELALSVSVCAYTPERKARGHSAPHFFPYCLGPP